MIWRILSYWARFLEDVEPDFAAFGHGLAGVNEGDEVAKGVFEDFDELAGEGDFGDEEDSGFAGFERFCGHLEVEIGFTATSNASEETSGAGGFLEGSKGIFLGRVEVDKGQFKKIWRFGGVRGCLRGFSGGGLWLDGRG